MEIVETTQVADVASRFPATIKVFQKRGIDFCCGGKRGLATACAEGGIDLSLLRTELQTAIACAPEDTDGLPEMPLDELTRHIVARYHDTLREELPRMERMMQKVLAVHGPKHPWLDGVAQTFSALRDDMLPHMQKEEDVLFPFISRMASEQASVHLPPAPFGALQNPIRMMEMEHEAVGSLLVELRFQTNGYVPPEGACNTFRGLYHAFAELERETHEHIHVENNILHPRAMALEARLRQVA
jgi:regulator of cell morphogenesis and NO signaling